MNIEKRNLIQAEASTAIINARFHGILDLSPRFGKTKTTLLALEKIDRVINVLITAPFNSILDSWKNEINLWGCKHNITYINDRSLDKVDWTTIDLVIKDEIHQISENQVEILRTCKKPIIGLTGSLSSDNKKYLKQTLGLLVKYTYTIEQAIEDKIISDFSVKVHYVELDNKIKNIEYGTKLKPLIGTELEVYNWASSQFERFKFMSYSNPALSNLKMKYAGVRTRIIYGSINKIKKTKSLLKTKTKALVFTGLTKVADNITLNSHHSKSNNDSLEKFLLGEINHLAVVNQLNMGFTDKKLKRIIVNQLQSKEENAIQRMMRAMNFEEGKEAVIDIIVVKDTVDEDWFTKAINWIPKDKVKIVK